MSKLIDAAQRMALKPPLARLERQRCLWERDDDARCAACLDVCPTKAVVLAQRKAAAEPWGSYDGVPAEEAVGPRIDDEACVRCGACVTACPTGALVALPPWDDDALLERVARAAEAAAVMRFSDTASEGTTGDADAGAGATADVGAAADADDTSAAMGFACERAANRLLLDAARTVVLPCLGWVDAALLVHAACAGAHQVTLLADGCASCELASAAAGLDDKVHDAQRIIDAWELNVQVGLSRQGTAGLLASADTEATGAPSRRGLFTQLRSSLADAAINAASAQVDALTGMSAKRAGDPQPDRRRWALLDDLHSCEHQDTIVPRTLAPHVDIDLNRCSGCALCAAFCPTGALRKAGRTPEGGTLLEFDASRCRDCGACEATCRYQAISCTEELTTDQLFALEPRALHIPKRRVLPTRRER